MPFELLLHSVIVIYIIATKARPFYFMFLKPADIIIIPDLKLKINPISVVRNSITI